MSEKDAGDAFTNTEAADDAGPFKDPFTQNVTVQVVLQYTYILLVSQHIMTPYRVVMTPSIQDIDSTVVAFLVSLFPSSIHEFLPEESRVLLLIFRSLGIHPLYVNSSDPKETLRRNELFGD